MPDDKNKRGKSDRTKVAAGQPHEVAYEASKSGVNKSKVLKAIGSVGNNRVKVRAELKKKK